MIETFEQIDCQMWCIVKLSSQLIQFYKSSCPVNSWILNSFKFSILEIILFL